MTGAGPLPAGPARARPGGLCIDDVLAAIHDGLVLQQEVDGVCVGGGWWIDQHDRTGAPGRYVLTNGAAAVELNIDVTLAEVDAALPPASGT